MDKFDRFQLLHRQFRSHRKPIKLSRLAELLECSEKTVIRTIGQMRDYLGAPLVYSNEHRGWHYSGEDKQLYELPGLWLTSSELQSLAMLLQLLDTFANGLLNQELGEIDSSINALLQARGIDRALFESHIKVIPVSSRYVSNKRFASVCEALLNQKQLQLTYLSYNKKASTRTVSPQTLVYYRENWYLDAWCHLRKELRTFSLARMQQVSVSPEQALSINNTELKAHFSESYGIFSGTAKFSAELRFSAQVSNEIALQQWHPKQEARWDGAEFCLSIPYSDHRELVQDILKHTPNVIVEAPETLKAEVLKRLEEGLAQYRNL